MKAVNAPTLLNASTYFTATAKLSILPFCVTFIDGGELSSTIIAVPGSGLGLVSTT